MKLVNKSTNAPPKLQTLKNNDPAADWEKFRRNTKRYDETSDLLRADQRGLCAYCEIDLLESPTDAQLADFRIEHFHPKSPHAPPPNWALEWSNLLGTCHGGSQKDVSDPTRFTAPDVCCDVPKENKDLTNSILNPIIDIPAFPRLFKFLESSGTMELDATLCPADKATKAEGSIRELNLNAPRLNRMREELMSELSVQIANLMASGLDAGDAATEVAEAMFPSPNPGRWPAFFTCIRWYLGPAAEAQLTKIGYSG